MIKKGMRVFWEPSPGRVFDGTVKTLPRLLKSGFTVVDIDVEFGSRAIPQPNPAAFPIPYGGHSSGTGLFEGVSVKQLRRAA